MLAKGKLQPQALEMEAAIISAIMIQSSAFVEVSGKLRADMFYSKKYAAIYTACKSLFDANQPIDLLTILIER